VNRRHLTSDICVILLLLAVALVFRFYQIGQIPPGLFPDEATHALDAQEVLDGQLTVYSPDEGSTGALWRYLLALFFRIVSPCQRHRCAERGDGLPDHSGTQPGSRVLQGP